MPSVIKIVPMSEAPEGWRKGLEPTPTVRITIENADAEVESADRLARIDEVLNGLQSETPVGGRDSLKILRELRYNDLQ